MTSDAEMILGIVLIIIIMVVCLKLDAIKKIFAAVGAVILWPYTHWKRKKAEKKYFKYIEEHKKELIEELMKQVRNETLGQQAGQNEADDINIAMGNMAAYGCTTEDIEKMQIQRGNKEKWTKHTMSRFMRRM